MKRTLIAVLLFLAVALAANAGELPKSVADLQARIPLEAKTPEGGLKLWFDCVFVYLGGDKTLGTALITEMTKDKDWQATMGYFVDALNSKPYIFRSYCKGATPDNQYSMDPTKYELDIRGTNTKPFEDYPEGKVVLIRLGSSGADSVRPVFMEANGRGEYKAREFSSICVGVRPPKQGKIFGADIPQSKDPLWVWKEFLHGVLVYLAGQEDRGKQLMTSLLMDGDLTLLTHYVPLSAEKGYIWRSYAKGTTVDNGYKVDPENFEIDAELKSPVTPTTTRVTVWVKTTGGNNPRPCIMLRDDRGQFRISELSSLCVGLQKVPKDPKADEF
jgi:hypothetical protein